MLIFKELLYNGTILRLASINMIVQIIQEYKSLVRNFSFKNNLGTLRMIYDKEMSITDFSNPTFKKLLSKYCEKQKP